MGMSHHCQCLYIQRDKIQPNTTKQYRANENLLDRRTEKPIRSGGMVSCWPVVYRHVPGEAPPARTTFGIEVKGSGGAAGSPT